MRSSRDVFRTLGYRVDAMALIARGYARRLDGSRLRAHARRPVQRGHGRPVRRPVSRDARAAGAARGTGHGRRPDAGSRREGDDDQAARGRLAWTTRPSSRSRVEPLVLPYFGGTRVDTAGSKAVDVEATSSRPAGGASRSMVGVRFPSGARAARRSERRCRPCAVTVSTAGSSSTARSSAGSRCRPTTSRRRCRASSRGAGTPMTCSLTRPNSKTTPSSPRGARSRSAVRSATSRASCRRCAPRSATRSAWRSRASSTSRSRRASSRRTSSQIADGGRDGRRRDVRRAHRAAPARGRGGAAARRGGRGTPRGSRARVAAARAS